MTARTCSRSLAATFVLACLTVSAPALAVPQGPYVTARDDGTVENPELNTLDGFRTLISKIILLYTDSGAPKPEVLSVWTTFPFGGEPVSTLFIPLVEDIGGLN